ncbi:MAG: flagellar protein FlaG [Thermacetogeniaceae bacterium]
MRVESSNATGDQARTLNLLKNHQAAERAQEAGAAERSSGKEGEGKANPPVIAEKSLAELLKSEYDISFQLSFTFHKETKSLIVKVIDPDTNKVIREIPPEELLELAARIQEMIGILFDKRV